MNSPVQLNERIGSLDFIRGIAILGILAMNIAHFSYPFFGAFNPYVYGFDSETDSLVRFLTYVFFDQKMMGLFTILFGAGFYLFIDRLDKKQLGLKVIDIYTKRLLWLFIFGVIHAYFIWPGDVLYHYAILAFFLFPFRTWKVKNLIYLVVFLLIIQLSNSLIIHNRTVNQYKEYRTSLAIQGDERVAKDSTIIKAWEKRVILKTKEDYEKETALRKGNYIDNFKANISFQEVHKGKLFYSSILFRNLMMMIIGLIFIKTGVFSNYKIWRYYWPFTIVTMLLGIGLCATYSYYNTYLYSMPVRTLAGVLSFRVGPMVLSIGYLLLFNGLFQKFFARLKFRPFSSVGKMAFTNYIMQSIICVIVFFGFGFNHFDQYNRTELWIIVIAIWVFQIILSLVWLKNHKYGPLEWLWRRLTYGKQV